MKVSTVIVISTLLLLASCSPLTEEVEKERARNTHQDATAFFEYVDQMGQKGFLKQGGDYVAPWEDEFVTDTTCETGLWYGNDEGG